MTACAWSGIVKMAVKQWTRASRVSVSAQVDTPENTDKQVRVLIVTSQQIANPGSLFCYEENHKKSKFIIIASSKI